MLKRVSELEGAALDWAVAKVSGYTFRWDSVREEFIFGPETLMCWLSEYRPSSDWAQGGPINEREIDCIRKRSKAEEADLAHPNPNFKFKAEIFSNINGYFCGHGPTPLIAAMRCYCCSKLGDEIDIPEELCQSQNS